MQAFKSLCVSLLEFSLSLHQHPIIRIPFSSRFTSYNKQRIIAYFNNIKSLEYKCRERRKTGKKDRLFFFTWTSQCNSGIRSFVTKLLSWEIRWGEWKHTQFILTRKSRTSRKTKEMGETVHHRPVDNKQQYLWIDLFHTNTGPGLHGVQTGDLTITGDRFFLGNKWRFRGVLLNMIYLTSE